MVTKQELIEGLSVDPKILAVATEGAKNIQMGAASYEQSVCKIMLEIDNEIVEQRQYIMIVFARGSQNEKAYWKNKGPESRSHYSEYEKRIHVYLSENFPDLRYAKAINFNEGDGWAEIELALLESGSLIKRSVGIWSEAGVLKHAPLA